MRLLKEDAEALDKILKSAIKEGKEKHPDSWDEVFYDLSTSVIKALGLDVPDTQVRHYAKLLNDSGIVGVDKLQGFPLLVYSFTTKNVPVAKCGHSISS